MHNVGNDRHLPTDGKKEEGERDGQNKDDDRRQKAKEGRHGGPAR